MQRADYELIKEFASDTSAHGVRYIFHGSKIFVKIIFLLIWISAVVFSIVRSGVCIHKYLSEKTTTRYEMHPASASAVMDFPTITVCNYNKVRKSYLEDKPALNELWGYIAGFQVDILANITWDGKYKQYENYTYGQILREGEMGNDTFISCTQGHIRWCEHTVMGADYYTRDIDMVSGSCFRINPEGTLQGRSGEYGVLTLILLADTPEYVDAGSYAGWILAAHESERFGSSIDNGRKISPGFAYSINMDTMIINNFEKHCAVSVDKKSGYGRYDQSTCLLDCRDELFNETCGCLNSLPPLNVRGYRECNLKELASCGILSYMNYVITYSDVTSDQSKCECEVDACKYSIFSNSVSATPISQAEARDKLRRWQGKDIFQRFAKYNFSVDELLENMAIIEVYFGSSSITNVEEILGYDFDNLLGDIGGVMGLFLGASVFTAIEFLILFINLISRYVSGKFGDKTLPTYQKGVFNETNL